MCQLSKGLRFYGCCTIGRSLRQLLREHLPQLSLFTNYPAPLVVCRAPFANIFDVAKTAQADFVFIQPAGADARGSDCRTDVAVERFYGFSRSGHKLDLFKFQLGTRMFQGQAFNHFAEQFVAFIAFPRTALFVVIEVETTVWSR